MKYINIKYNRGTFYKILALKTDEKIRIPYIDNDGILKVKTIKCIKEVYISETKDLNRGSI